MNQVLIDNCTASIVVSPRGSKCTKQFVKPPKIEPIESSYSGIQKRKQKKEEQYIRETNEAEQNYILGESFRSRLELLQENKTLLG